ncbi:MAG: hypothetical protein ACK5TO_13030 [Planctomycetaceae bacterium]
MPVVEGTGRLQGVVRLDEILDLRTEKFAPIRGLLQTESPARLAEA